MFLHTALLSLFAAAWPAASAPAALIISVGSATVPAGGTAAIDVFVTGPDRLDYFVAEFRLTPVGPAPAGGLRFVAPPPLPPLTAAGYVFAGNSYAESQLPANPGAVTATLSAADTYTVGDFTLDALGADVTTPRLLARLAVTAGGAVPDGASYTLSLNPTGSQFQDTGFANIPFASSAGVIRVTGGPDVQSVPEPGSAALLLVGAVACAFRRRRNPAVVDARREG